MNLGIMDLRFMLKNPEYASPEGFNWNSPGFIRGYMCYCNFSAPEEVHLFVFAEAILTE
jgi:hypothetical protein